MAISAPKFIQPLANDHTNVGKLVVVELTLDASYPTGGYAVDFHAYGLSEVWMAWAVQVAPSGTTNQVFEYNPVTAKIQSFGGAASGVALAETANATNLSTTVLRIAFYGLGS